MAAWKEELMTSDFPKITFGIIVLNGEPFTRYNLRSLYPFAHEIIVAEGANPNSASVATADGHSIDGTLDVLREFKAREDPEDKVQIITRDGFWTEKDEQSQAYAARATGDYLWQIDIDEFYRPEDIESIINLLRDLPEITQVNMEQHTFWGGFGYLVDGLHLKQFYRGLKGVPRIFKWGEGYSYLTHRPPTVADAAGRDLSKIRLISGRDLTRQGIYCYHYSMCFPNQIDRKMIYYSRTGWDDHNDVEEWAQTTFRSIQKPLRVYHLDSDLSWLKRFHGTHPPQIEEMISDISSGEIEVVQRPVEDIEALLGSRRYRIGGSLIDRLSTVFLALRRFLPTISRLVQRIVELVFSPTPTSSPKKVR
jgi:hypothetical protein